MSGSCGKSLSSRRTRNRQYVYCSHCNSWVSHATYYRHQSDQTSGYGKKPKRAESSSDSEFELENINANDEQGTWEDTVMLQNDQNLVHADEDGIGSDNDSDFCLVDSQTNLDSSDCEMEFSMPKAQASVPIELEFENSCDEDEPFDQIGPRPCMPKTVRLLFCFLLMWQFAFTISDSGIGVMILFFYHFFRLLDPNQEVPALQQIVEWWPKTLCKARRLIDIDKFKVVEYVVCTRCSAIYNLNDCYEKRGSQVIPKTCDHILFPNHPNISRRKKCGAQLLKVVRNKKKEKLLPLRVFCYNSVIDNLKRLIARPNFLNSCQHWRNRKEEMNIFSDIYDGQVWKDFQIIDGHPFLKEEHSIAFGMNVDWFEPYDRTPDAVGAMYLTVLNLPRDERYKPENILLCGIIPGPREPKKVMNSFLSPTVKDLHSLWDGVMMFSSCGVPVKIRAAILLFAADIPATRKLMGFIGHSAELGCSKCLQKFPALVGRSKRDYSGVDRERWNIRNNEDHRQGAKSYLEANSEAEQDRIASKNGCRYTALLELSYIDPVRFHVIDPMHNLLLGTANHMMRIWTEEKIIDTKQLKLLHNSVEKIIAPLDIGRMPSKILSSFSGFTADQWKNWTLIFSPIVLKGILPPAHLRCWLIFVNACKLLCSPQISKEEVEMADQYLVLFLTNFKSLYGAVYFTPNLHLHLHLKNCVLDYGPVYAFWCFAFERYNGILGRYQTNNRAIEVQFMHKFLMEQEMSSIEIPVTADSGIDKMFKWLRNPKGRRVINSFKDSNCISMIKKLFAHLLLRNFDKLMDLV